MINDTTIRVLIVEDNPADVALIEQLLHATRSTNFELIHSETIEASLARIGESKVDVVLLDLSLPDSTGIEACEKIRQAKTSIPVVILTGLDDEQVAIDAVQRGAQDYLVKGEIDSDVLVRSLRYAIERQRIETELQQAHDELEKRVAERTSDLTMANEELKRVIIERERAEESVRKHRESLAHVARLNTLGEMATGLAHEVNQPLTAVVAYTRSCLRRFQQQDLSDETVRGELMDQMEKAAEQAKRAGDIIHRLRRLVSKRDSEREPTDVNDCVRTVAKLVESDSQTCGIELRLILHDNLPDVQADRIQVEQVLLNLIRNGFDAMSEATASRRELIVKTACDVQDNIEIKVIDQGDGADAEALSHLFDAFYTTKEDGLGLGLSISRSIIEAHQGKLSVSPNVDAGLTFRFTIPIPTDSVSNDHADEQNSKPEHDATIH